jgi:hypothetical protein
MSSDKMPMDLDVIEQLYADGQVRVSSIVRMAADASTAWRMIASLLGAHAADLNVTDISATRRLDEWEVAALLRNRLHGSAEATPPDEALRLHSTERTKEAYHRDFGKWFDRHK